MCGNMKKMSEMGENRVDKVKCYYWGMGYKFEA